MGHIGREANGWLNRPTKGRTGWTGWTDGNQKCPLKFFKLCGHLELVYIYLYTK